jgi:rRNA-processing protein FCF1
MPELPSRYSSTGLSDADQRRVITVGTPRNNRPIGAIKIEERVNNVLEYQTHHDQQEEGDIEGDIPMIGMDDEEEVQIISNFVTEKREEPDFVRSFTETIAIGDDLTPESRQSRDILMVVDTNFMISHLDIIDELAKLSSKYHHRIVIPFTVVRELDGLKGSRRTADDLISGKTVGHLARWANDWIYRMLAERHSAVAVQKLREVTDKEAIKDDSILDCCIYFKDRTGALVILLSNDKNLCMKALAHEILTVSYRKGMTADLIARKSFEENGGQHWPNHDDFMEEDLLKPMEQPVSHDIIPYEQASELIYSEVQKVVLEALDFCMYAEYEDDLELIGYRKSRVLTLSDASNVLIKYWVSVFTEYFQRGVFKPFKTHGKKQPQHVRTPTNHVDLVEFIKYWSEVLRGLYIKRDDRQNLALEKIIKRWEKISKSTP